MSQLARLQRQSPPNASTQPEGEPVPIGPKSARPDVRGMSYQDGVAAMSPEGPRATQKVKQQRDGTTVKSGVVYNEQTDNGYAQTRVNGTAGYKDGVTAIGNVSQIEGDSTSKRERGISGGIGKGGPQLGVKQTDTLMAGKKNQQSVSRGLALEGGQVSASQENTAKWKETDGTERATSSQMKLGVGKSGPSFGAGTSNKTTQQDGTSTTSTTSASANILTGEVAGSMGTATKDKAGKVQSSANVSGGAKVDKSGAIRSANLKGGLQKKGTSVSAGVAYDVSAEGPVEIGEGQWAVDWTKSVQGSGSVGAQVGAASAQVGGELHKSKSGRRVFGTQAEAQRFADNIASELAHIQTAPPQSAEAAANMKVGEEIQSESGRSMNAKASVKVAGVTAGVGGASGSSSSRTVRKVSATLVEVEVTKSEFDRFDASLGLGATLGSSTSDTSGRSVLVRFDLSKAAGREAFEQYQAGEKVTGTGGIASVAIVMEKGHEEKSSLTAPKVGVTNSASTSERIVADHTGQLNAQFAGKNTKGRTLAVPFVGGKQVVTTGIQQAARGNEAKSYDVTSTVDDSRGKDAREDLAAATGTDFVSGDAKSSGKWQVSSEFTVQEIDEFTRRLSGADGDTSALLAKQAHGEKLVTALGAAQSIHDRMRAISDFVAHAGPRGLQVIRDNIGRYRGGRRQGFDLALPGDPWFQGPEHRRELEARIGLYRTQARVAGTNLSTLAGGAARDATWVGQRLQVLQDPKRYTDLPSGLRELEIRRTEGWVRALAEVQKGLYDAMAARKNDDSATKASAPSQAKGESAKTPNREKGDAVAPEAEADTAKLAAVEARAGDVEAQVAAADARLNEALGRSKQAKAAVAKSRWVHFRNPFGTGAPAVQRVGDAASKAGYERAKRQWPYASSQWDKGLEHQSLAGILRAQAFRQPNAAGRLVQLRIVLAELERATACVELAVRSFELQERDFQQIEARHQSHHEELFGGRGMDMPAGEVV